MRGSRDEGDTIIEVMFAFVVFSSVVVGAILLMNKGVALAQRSVEITLVRQHIDAQVLMLKHMQYHDRTRWDALITDHLIDTSAIQPFGGSITTCPAQSAITQGFFLGKATDPSAIQDDGTSGATVIDYYGLLGNYDQAVTYSMVDYAPEAPDTPKTYGLWVQIVRAESEDVISSGTAYDAHIRACWGSVGSAQPVTIGTVTRIYDGS